jgi:arylsulfatase A-like enzyme
MIVALGSLAVSLAGLSQAQAGDSPHVILIMVDTLRSDHVSSYGYGRPTTPQLDMWLAQEGALFTNASSSAPWTYPANAGIFTGKQPANLHINWSQWQQPENVIPASETLLAEHLQQAGYTTAAFVTGHFVRGSLGFAQGFDVYEEHIRGNNNKVRAEELNTAAMQWLTNEWDNSQPLFLYLYYFDPHTWYNPPSPFDTLYDNTYTGTLTADTFQDGRIVIEGDIIPTARDIEHLIALYDGSITYWDTYFGEMMTVLDSLGILDNSLIILTSDHGEMFGEHNHWVHRGSIYEEVLRVPFVVRYSGVISPGQVITAPIATIDILPTTLDLLGLPVPVGDGMSLAAVLRGEAEPAFGRSVYSQADATTDPTSPAYFLGPHQEIRAVQQNGWKYIYTFGQTDQELYQLQPQSLYEPANLAQTNPGQVELLHDSLNQSFFLPTDYTYLPAVQSDND